MGLKEDADAVLTSGEVPGVCITRAAVADGFADINALKADPLWEQDPITDNWIRRAPEFFAARAVAEEALPSQREAAEIALGVALLELAKDLPPQADGPPFEYVPGLGPYHEICSHVRGTMPSYLAEPHRWHRTSGGAIAEWRKRMLAFAAEHQGDILLWHERPEITGRVHFGHTEVSWAIYSRLLIGRVADTLIERIKRGEITPRIEMLRDNVVTSDQLSEAGYIYDEKACLWSRPGWIYDVTTDQWTKNT